MIIDKLRRLLGRKGPHMAAVADLATVASDATPTVTSCPHGYAVYRSYADPLYSPWLVDTEFRALLDKVMADVRQSPDCGTIPDGYLDGRYIQWSLARHAALLGGDFVEMGVHLGIGSHLFGFVLDRYGSGHQALWSIDSFEGLSEPDASDVNPQNGETFWRKHSLNNVSVPYIRSMLGQHSCKVHVVQGWIPDVFKDISLDNVAFVHIDVDIHQPTIDALSFIYDKVVPGGIMLFDDYGFPMCPGARKAIDDFFRDKKEVIIPLPTGQAMAVRI